MSTWLRENASPGTELDLVGPAGSFYLRAVSRPLLLLAGGTGLAPFLSMLGALAASGTVQPIHLVYGVTNDADLVEIDRLQAFAACLPNFTFTTTVAAETSTHPHKGYVTAHIAAEHLNAGDVDVYLCGPPPMVDAVRTWLTQRGVTPAHFYYEKFSPSGAVTAIGETHSAAA
jgi:benzoate/toluate 1,2-dioxygenase reductase subunit